jgi:hypothetical protein
VHAVGSSHGVLLHPFAAGPFVHRYGSDAGHIIFEHSSASQAGQLPKQLRTSQQVVQVDGFSGHEDALQPPLAGPAVQR